MPFCAVVISLEVYSLGAGAVGGGVSITILMVEENRQVQDPISIDQPL